MSKFELGGLVGVALLAIALPAAGQSVNLFPANAEAQWTRIAVPPTNPVSDVAQWHLNAAKGSILCDGNGGHDWFKFNHELRNFTFHVKWRFTPVPGSPKYNSGVFFRNNGDGSIWHQAQTTLAGGYFFGMTPVNGAMTHFSEQKTMTENRVKPAGKWNVYDIRCVAKTCTLAVNGATVNTVQIGVERGYIGLESEGYKIEFKDFKVTELP